MTAEDVSREEKLKSARQKLKSYRARQAKQGGSVSSRSSSSRRASLIAGSDTVPASPSKRMSMTGHPEAAQKHAHRRSISRSGINVVMPSPTHTKRMSASQRRHSRTDSMLLGMPTSATSASGMSNGPTPPTSATMNRRHSRTESSLIAPSLLEPTPTSSLYMMPSPIASQWAFPNSPATPLSPAMPMSGRSKRSSLPYPSPNMGGMAFNVLPPPNSASKASRRNTLQQIPASPQPESPSSSATTPSSAGSGKPSHARRASRHARQTSVSTRRESMEIMSGLIASGSIASSNPNYLAAVNQGSPDLLTAGGGTSPTFPYPASPRSPMLHDVGERRETNRMGALQALEGKGSSPINSSSTSPVIDVQAILDAGSHSPNMSGFGASAEMSSAPMNKRASWGAAASAMALQGGRGALDLGMLVEEEEEEEEEDCEKAVGEDSGIVIASPPPQTAALPAMSSHRLSRPRPASLFLPPQDSSLFGTATQISPLTAQPTADFSASSVAPSPMSNFSARPLNLSMSMSSTSTALTTPSSAGGSADIMSKSQRRRSSVVGGGLRSLTLANNSVTSPSAEVPPVVSPTTQQQRRRSLMSSSPSVASTVSSPARSMSVSSTSSPLTNRLRRSSLAASVLKGAGSPPSAPVPLSNAASRRPTSSISYKPAAVAASMGYSFPSTPVVEKTASPFGFGGLVMEESEEDQSTAAESDETAAYLEKIAALETSLTAAQATIESTASELRIAQSQLIGLQTESERGFSDLEARTGEETRNLHLRVFQLEGLLEAKKVELSSLEHTHRLEVERLTQEFAEQKEQLLDATQERDELRDDVDGWRGRCADLERTVERERARLDEERREGMLAREKIRKLGDRLAASAAAGSSAAPTEEAALAAAQAKLIGEMRDQIFSLAGALEREKRDHASTQASIQRMQDEQATLVHDDFNSAAVKELERALPSHSHGSQDSASSFNRSFGSFGAGNATDTTDDTSFNATDSSFGGCSAATSFSSSSKNRDSDFPAAPVALGGLHTLAEEDEEEEEEEEIADLEAGGDADNSAWTDEDAVPELDFHGTHTEMSSRTTKLGSTCSTVDDPSPATPVKETPTPSHQRSDSFIKQWTFPKGPVQPIQIVEPDDHIFFSLSTAEVLPPLPVTPDAIDLPAYFASELVVDEEVVRRSLDFSASHVRRPSSPRPSFSAGPSPIRSSFSSVSGGPPTARSARMSAMLSFSEQGSWSASNKAVSRMSLQGISSLITSYVSAVPSMPSSPGVVNGMAHAAAGLCHRQEDSVFAEDHRPFLRAEPPAPMRFAPRQQPRTLPKSEQKRPVASPLHVLDFTRACGVSPSKVMKI